MAVIKKTKTISKSKTIKGSISRKQFNKFRKSGSTTRKMRGGAKFIIKPSNSGPGKMKSKKNLLGRAQSWVKLHAPGGKAIQSKRNEQAKLTQIAHMAKQRAEYYKHSTRKGLDPTYAEFQQIPAKIFNSEGHIIGSTALHPERVEASRHTSSNSVYAIPKNPKESYV